MLDFSFLKNRDAITISDESELEAILPLLDEAGIRFPDGNHPTIAIIRSTTQRPVRYLIFYDEYPSIGLCVRLGLSQTFECATSYTASEVLQLIYPEPSDEDFEPSDESSLRDFLSV